MASKYLEPAREVDVIDDVDVIVVGGGPAGVCAAVAAARAGARTFLIERHGFLGGMWTAGMVLTLAGYNSWLRPYDRCVGGVPAEWLARAASMGGAEDNNSWVLNSDPEAMKVAADQLLAESGVKCLLHTWGATPIVEDGSVVGVMIENVDGRTAIMGKVTVDCTGNGDMFVRSGAKWVKGNTLQPMTMPFRIGNVDLDPKLDHAAPALIPIGPDALFLRDPILSQFASRRPDVDCDRDAMRQARAEGKLPLFGGPWFGGLDKNIAWVNTTRILGDASIAAELTRAEIEGRRDSFTLFNYFRDNLPGFEKAQLLHTSTQIGVRETRRLVGGYTMTGADIQNNVSFADGIALGCWPIDVHPAKEDVGVHAMYVPLPYQIPYRALLPQGVGGLIAAGRCISVDRDALGSTRVGATCAATGQAAGVAAAIAAAAKVQPHEVDVPTLRARLVSQGAIVDPPRAAA
jgi:hypothetical protein